MVGNEAFIQKLEKAINDKWTTACFYHHLKKDTTDSIFQEFIERAMKDEVKHYRLFQTLYYFLTRAYHKVDQQVVSYDSFEEGVIHAMKAELERVEDYQEMLFEIPVQEAYYPLFVAMHDEMGHAIRFGTIYGRLGL